MCVYHSWRQGRSDECQGSQEIGHLTVFPQEGMGIQTPRVCRGGTCAQGLTMQRDTLKSAPAGKTCQETPRVRCAISVSTCLEGPWKRGIPASQQFQMCIWDRRDMRAGLRMSSITGKSKGENQGPSLWLGPLHGSCTNV